MKLSYLDTPGAEYEKIFDGAIGLSNIDNGVLARQLIASPSSPLIKQKISRVLGEASQADKELGKKLDLEDIAFSLSHARLAGRIGTYSFNLKIFAKKR